LLCSPAGNDLLYDDALIEQGRNFCNKIWNALRLVKGWPVDDSLAQPEANRVSVGWFNSAFNAALQNINALYDDYRLSEALMAVYKLVWDDFCSWFLEMVKPAYQQPIDRVTLEAVVEYFDKLLKVLHPFMPFITEEAWHILAERGEGESLMMCRQPGAESYDPEIIAKFGFAEEVIMAVRNVRKEKNIPQKEAIRLFIRKNNREKPDVTYDPVVEKLCNLSELGYVEEKVEDSLSFVVGTTEFFIPLKGKIDVTEEIKKLEEELAYMNGFLQTVLRKLSNEKFVNNAPEAVVASERKKQSDAEARIRVLEQQINGLK